MTNPGSPFDLTGRLAVVTGCRRGIGFAMAQALAQAGADIIGVSVHLEPDGSASIILPGGEQWGFTAVGARLVIEESTHYAELIGPLRALQIVLRGVCYGAADVRWTLRRVERAAPERAASETTAGGGVASGPGGELA